MTDIPDMTGLTTSLERLRDHWEMNTGRKDGWFKTRSNETQDALKAAEMLVKEWNGGV